MKTVDPYRGPRMVSRFRIALIVIAALPSILLLFTLSALQGQSSGTHGIIFPTATIIVAVLVGIIVWRVPLGISRSFEMWTQSLARHNAGKAGGDWPKATYREWNVLGLELKKMSNTLQEMMHEADRTSQMVSTTQNKIVSSCEKQVCGAQEQSQAISETSSAAAELSRSSEQIGANIRNISQMADHVLAGMEKIKVATDQTNRILTSLNEKSKQIGHITELIDDVADQTNLLAVNASIEAARAGEQGRGFTVVADQISKLADSTGKSTKDITALVEIIQHEMSNAIIAMEQSLEGVEEEIQLTKDSASKSREIAMNANQQISGSRQIAEAMASIDQTMKQIVNDAREAATEASGLSGVSEELKACIFRYQNVETKENAQEMI